MFLVKDNELRAKCLIYSRVQKFVPPMLSGLLRKNRMIGFYCTICKYIWRKYIYTELASRLFTTAVKEIIVTTEFSTKEKKRFL